MDIVGNEEGDLNGQYSVLRICGDMTEIVSVVLEDDEKVVSVDMPLKVVELSRQVIIEGNKLRWA